MKTRHNTRRQRSFIMFPKFDFIRRFANQVADLVTFDMDVDIVVSEDDLLEDLAYRGCRAYVGC